jgi:hypothetical protein
MVPPSWEGRSSAGGWYQRRWAWSLLRPYGNRGAGAGRGARGAGRGARGVGAISPNLPTPVICSPDPCHLFP